MPGNAGKPESGRHADKQVRVEEEALSSVMRSKTQDKWKEKVCTVKRVRKRYRQI